MVRHATKPLVDELPRLKMTYEEFLNWSGDSTHADWVDGEVIVFMPPAKRHQLVFGLLFGVIERFIGLFDLGILLSAPFEMRVSNRASYEPDLLFLARDHVDRLTDLRLLGPADLAIEIRSDSTAIYDEQAKFLGYERAGIPEYWMIDPRPNVQPIHGYRLSGSLRYESIASDERGRFHSEIIAGFWFEPDWFRSEVLPDPEDLLMELAPEAYLRKITNAFESRRRSVGNGSSHR